MFGINFDFGPTQALVQGEREAADRLAAAQREDDERKAEVNAGTRQPPGRGERPYLAAGRDRHPIHAADATPTKEQS